MIKNRSGSNDYDSYLFLVNEDGVYDEESETFADSCRLFTRRKLINTTHGILREYTEGHEIELAQSGSLSYQTPAPDQSNSPSG